MLRLSKKIEYGLIAIRHIAHHSAMGVSTTKEIAERYDISYELLAKILPKLAKSGLLLSHSGVKGGYTLARKAEDISVSSIINAIEGKPTVADCFHADDPESCSIYNTCTIKSPLGKIQSNIDRVFSKMTLSEIV